MIVIGLILLAAAVAAAIVLIAQNTGTVDVHALGGTWSVNLYWVIVAGMVIPAVAFVGLTIVKLGGSRARRLRRERRELTRKNQQLSDQVSRDGPGDPIPPMPPPRSAN